MLGCSCAVKSSWRQGSMTTKQRALRRSESTSAWDFGARRACTAAPDCWVGLDERTSLAAPARVPTALARWQGTNEPAAPSCPMVGDPWTRAPPAVLPCVPSRPVFVDAEMTPPTQGRQPMWKYAGWLCLVVVLSCLGPIDRPGAGGGSRRSCSGALPADPETQSSIWHAVL